MRYQNLPNIELNFSRTLNAAGKQLTKTTASLPYAVGLKTPKNKHFIEKRHTKNKIVLHFTAGVLTGDIFTLTENTVSVAFVLARDGTVYELFNPDFAAYHLGIGQGYKNGETSFKSIGIEISNLGPLTLKDDILYDIYGKAYCSVSDTGAYDKIDYRGYKYYCSYTEEQYSSLKKLISDICKKYNIPFSGMPENLRFSTAPAIAQKSEIGIVSHVNFRPDKFDLAPNFAWNKIL